LCLASSPQVGRLNTNTAVYSIAMVEDNLSRLEVTSGVPKLRADYTSGRQVHIEPFGGVSFLVYEDGECLGLIHGDDLADHMK